VGSHVKIFLRNSVGKEGIRTSDVFTLVSFVHAGCRSGKNKADLRVYVPLLQLDSWRVSLSVRPWLLG